MQTEETAMLPPNGVAAEMEPSSSAQDEGDPIQPLDVSQSLLYGAGGIAGGLVFTMMNNALPLFLLSYSMPLGLPAFLNPGGPIPATIVALLSNERSLFGGLIQPFVGYLSDRTRTRIGKRSPYLIAGGLGTTLCIALLALQPPFWLMIAIVTLTGLALFVALGPYAALLADITPYDQRGRIGSLMAVMGVVGALIFTFLSIAFWETGRGWVLLITAVVTGLSLVVVALGVREPANLHARPADKVKMSALLAAMVKNRPLATYVAAMTVYWLGAGAAAPFITRFGIAELGIEQDTSFWLLLIVVLGTSVGAVLCGWLGDKWGRKRVLQPALVLFAVAALLGSQLRDIWTAIPVMVLVGLGNAAPTALHISLLADLVPKNRAGTFMGFANMIWSVAQPIGSLVAGLLVDATGSYRGVFIMASICMLAAAIIMTRVPNGPTNIEPSPIQAAPSPEPSRA